MPGSVSLNVLAPALVMQSVVWLHTRQIQVLSKFLFSDFVVRLLFMRSRGSVSLILIYCRPVSLHFCASSAGVIYITVISCLPGCDERLMHFCSILNSLALSIVSFYASKCYCFMTALFSGSVEGFIYASVLISSYFFSN